MKYIVLLKGRLNSSMCNCIYSHFSLRQTPLGQALSVCLREMSLL